MMPVSSSIAELADLPMTQGTRHVIEEARRLLAAETPYRRLRNVQNRC